MAFRIFSQFGRTLIALKTLPYKFQMWFHAKVANWVALKQPARFSPKFAYWFFNDHVQNSDSIEKNYCGYILEKPVLTQKMRIFK